MSRGKGHISLSMTVWCGLCDEWAYLESKTKTSANQEAVSKGWKFTGVRDTGWICTECAKTYKEVEG